MSLASIVRALVEAGCSPKQILAAVEAGEAATREKEEARRALQRERVRRHRVKRAVTLQDVTPPPPERPSEPSSEPVEVIPNPHPPIVPPAPRGGPSAGALQAAFESFWQAYPKRDGSNPRKPAFERFASKVRAGADPGEIVRGAQAYARSMAGKEAQFVAQAVTWLNQERWRDHAPAPGLFAGPEPPIPKAVPASSPEELDRRKRQAVANGYWSQMLWGPVPDDIRERVNVQ